MKGLILLIERANGLVLIEPVIGRGWIENLIGRVEFSRWIGLRAVRRKP